MSPFPNRFPFKSEPKLHPNEKRRTHTQKISLPKLPSIKAPIDPGGKNRNPGGKNSQAMGKGCPSPFGNDREHPAGPWREGAPREASRLRLSFPSVQQECEIFFYWVKKKKKKKKHNKAVRGIRTESPIPWVRVTCPHGTARPCQPRTWGDALCPRGSRGRGCQVGLHCAGQP